MDRKNRRRRQYVHRRGRRHDRRYDDRRWRDRRDDLYYEEQPDWRRPSTVLRYWGDHPWAYDPIVMGLAVPGARRAGQAAYERMTAARTERLGSLSHQELLAHIAHLQGESTALAAAGAPASVRVAVAVKLTWARFRALDPAVQGIAGLIGGGAVALTAAVTLLWVWMEAAWLLPVLIALIAWGMRARTHKVGLTRYLLLTARTILPTIGRAERDQLRADGAPTARWAARVTVRWLVALLRHELIVTAVTLTTLTTWLLALGLRTVETVMAVSRPAWWVPVWGDVDVLLGTAAAGATAVLFWIARRRRTAAEATLMRQAEPRRRPGTDLTEEA